jgi:hypothetical protein
VAAARDGRRTGSGPWRGRGRRGRRRTGSGQLHDRGRRGVEARGRKGRRGCTPRAPAYGLGAMARLRRRGVEAGAYGLGSVARPMEAALCLVGSTSNGGKEGWRIKVE